MRLTFELGSGPLTMTTTKAYNTGTWYKIALQRNKRKGGVTILSQQCFINKSDSYTVIAPRLLNVETIIILKLLAYSIPW